MYVLCVCGVAQLTVYMNIEYNIYIYIYVYSLTSTTMHPLFTMFGLVVWSSISLQQHLLTHQPPTATKKNIKNHINTRLQHQHHLTSAIYCSSLLTSLANMDPIIDLLPRSQLSASLASTAVSFDDPPRAGIQMRVWARRH